MYETDGRIKLDVVWCERRKRIVLNQPGGRRIEQNFDRERFVDSVYLYTYKQIKYIPTTHTEEKDGVG